MGVLDKFLNAMKLNDDYDDDGYLDDEIEDDYEEERPKRHFFQKKKDDDFDDYQDDFKINKEPVHSQKKTSQKSSSSASYEKSSLKQVKTQQTSSKVSPIRPRRTNGMEVCVIKPKSMEDAREITIAQRIIDFSSGSCFALSGALQKVSSYIFIITPSSVDVSGDIQEILSGVDVPSMSHRY